MVTKINGHADKRSSEIITLKTVKGFNNNIKQPNVMIIVLWLNANFKTGFRKRKFGEKPGIFDLSNAKK